MPVCGNTHLDWIKWRDKRLKCAWVLQVTRRFLSPHWWGKEKPGTRGGPRRLSMIHNYMMHNQLIFFGLPTPSLPETWWLWCGRWNELFIGGGRTNPPNAHFRLIKGECVVPHDSCWCGHTFPRKSWLFISKNKERSRNIGSRHVFKEI